MSTDELSPEEISALLRDYKARRGIHKAVCNYIRGQDRLLPDIQLQAFHEDARVDCGLFAGTAKEFVDFAQNFLANCEGSQHLLGQVDLEIDGDRAVGEVYFIAWHRIEEDGEPKDLFVAGRYQDRYEERDGVWRIADRREVIDWASTVPAADAFLRNNPSIIRATRRQREW